MNKDTQLQLTETTKKEKNINKLFFLDGIKGIACLCIAFNHFMNVFYSKGIAQQYNIEYYNFINNFPICRLLYNGNFYLMIFLLVSAFLISYLLIKKNDVLYYKKTILKRGTRIVLPVFIICIIVYILYKLQLFRWIEQTMNITLSQTGDVKCFSNLSIKKIILTSIKCLFTTQTSFNFVFWMLPILYRGFFISVILSFLISNMETKKAILILVIATLTVGFLISNTLILFPIGTMLAYCYLKKQEIKAKNIFNNKTIKIILKIIATIFLIIGFYLGSTPYNNEFSGYYYVLKYIPKLTFTNAHILGSIFVISSILILKNIQTVLSMKIFTFLGKISFSIYLVHFPLQCSLVAWIFVRTYSIILSYVPAIIITIPIYFALLIVSGFIFQKFVEVNLEKLNNKFVNKLIK